MPKGDTWPGAVAMESFSQLDSAGSYDSVISMNSGCSEDSMEHLTAEERACIMYLEEMIEALEVQEDSGLSNDEPDPGFLADDISSFRSDEKPEPAYRALTIEYKAEHCFLNETSEPLVPATNTKDVETSLDLITQSKPPVTDSAPDYKMQPSASELSVFTDGDGHLKIVPSASLCPSQSTGTTSELDVCVIPPPSDFMDEPDLPPQPQTGKDPPPPAGICGDKPGETVDLEQLRQRAAVRRTPPISSVTQEPPSNPPELSPLPLSPGASMSPLPEAADLRSPPAVAPKPRKLPANIFLKPHKAAAVSSNGSPGHLVPTGGDRLLLDHQRVHMEALRKLGLLPAEADRGPPWSPDVSPKSRKSWTAPVSPVSCGTPRTVPFKPSFNRINSSPAGCITAQSPVAMSPLAMASAPAVQSATILPAPAAFSDPDGPEVSEVKNASEAKVTAQVSTPPVTPPVLVKHLSLPKVNRSGTLERSGLDLSSYMAHQDSSMTSQGSHIRKNRTRPASLGSGKDFTSAGGEESQVGHTTSKEPDLRRSLPAFQHLGDSPKMPRSQGISVLICPRAESREDRHNALKKLGLLRD